MPWALTLRSDALTPFWIGVTQLGEVGFFLVAVPVAYWLWRKDAVLRIGILLTVSAALNAHLKHALIHPRPFMVAGSGIDAVIEAHGWSMPSGHAQTSAVFWGACAWELRRRWAWATAAILMVLVSLSRVVLGVHYLQDVLVGLAVGLALLVIAYRVGPSLAAGLDRRSLWVQAALATIAVVAWLGLIRLTAADDVLPRQAGVGLGALLGIWVGSRLERRELDFQPPVSWRARVGAVAVGIAGVLGLRFGLRAALDPLPLPEAFAYVARYAVIGLWIGWAAPWVFVRLGLCRSGYSPRP